MLIQEQLSSFERLLSLTTATPIPAPPHSRFVSFQTSDLQQAQAYCRNVMPCFTGFNKQNGSFVSSYSYAPMTRLRILVSSMRGTVWAQTRGIVSQFFVVFIIRGAISYRLKDRVLEARAGDLLVHNPGEDFDGIASDDFQQIAIEIDVDLLTNALCESLGRPIMSSLHFDLTVVRNGAAAPLTRFISLCCTELDQHGGILDETDLSERYQSILLSLVLKLLPHNHTALIRNGFPTAVPYYVHRAERFIQNNLRESISTDDIAQASGVHSRTLHTGFRKFRNITPMAFLKECRLRHVREELLRAIDSGKNVTEIAQEYGFTHLSKFSISYQNRFGELPSQTRRSGRP